MLLPVVVNVGRAIEGGNDCDGRKDVIVLEIELISFNRFCFKEIGTWDYERVCWNGYDKRLQVEARWARGWDKINGELRYTVIREVYDRKGSQ